MLNAKIVSKKKKKNTGGKSAHGENRVVSYDFLIFFYSLLPILLFTNKDYLDIF
jgi:hypothetical protein